MHHLIPFPVYFHSPSRKSYLLSSLHKCLPSPQYPTRTNWRRLIPLKLYRIKHWWVLPKGTGVFIPFFQPPLVLPQLPFHLLPGLCSILVDWYCVCYHLTHLFPILWPSFLSTIHKGSFVSQHSFPPERSLMVFMPSEFFDNFIIRCWKAQTIPMMSWPCCWLNFLN